ncbi:MFS transporter, partial [Enterobacter hormaechei]
SETRRSVVFGLWSTFMAGGIALSMLFGPLLADWRADWQLSALLVLVAALLLPPIVGRREAGRSWHVAQVSGDHPARARLHHLQPAVL